jgi:hypothetical protein
MGISVLVVVNAGVGDSMSRWRYVPKSSEAVRVIAVRVSVSMYSVAALRDVDVGAETMNGCPAGNGE